MIDLLRKEIPLSEKYHDHLLSGNWQGFRECVAS
ncbi:MAG: type II toxin-antitoxin system YafQ family toxin [Treponema sp.]